MSVLTPVIIHHYNDMISSFERWSNTYIKRNNKKMLLTILYNFQNMAIEFSQIFDNTYKDYEDLSYEMYLAAVQVRRFIDGYYSMSSDERDKWTNKYDNMNETNGITMTGNKWVNETEIYFIMN